MSVKMVPDLAAKAQEMANVAWERYATRRQLPPNNPPKVEVAYVLRDRQITTVVLNNQYVGSTKFNPADPKFNKQVGRLKAASRAVRKMLREHAANL